jgi:hypothetical protein
MTTGLDLPLRSIAPSKVLLSSASMEVLKRLSYVERETIGRNI